jgi:hypothetical protein
MVSLLRTFPASSEKPVSGGTHMNRTKFMLAGLLAGAMLFGTACKADRGAEREGVGARPAPPMDSVDGAGVDDTEGWRQEPEERPTGDEGLGGAGADDDLGPEGGRGGRQPGEWPEDTGGAGDEGLREGVRDPDDFGREPDDDVGGAGFEEPGRDVEGEPLGEEDFGDEPPMPRH